MQLVARVSIIAAFLLAFISCTDETNIDYKKYEILTLAREINIYYDIPLDTSGNSEESRIRKFIDGSYELKYSYDLTGTENFSPLFYSVKVERLLSEKDAIDNFDQAKLTLMGVNKAVGQSFTEIDSIEMIGDQSFYAVRTKDDDPVGVFLIVRSKDRMYTLIMAGLYSSDHSLISDLILPKLTKLSEFRLEGYE